MGHGGDRFITDHERPDKLDCVTIRQKRRGVNPAAWKHERIKVSFSGVLQTDIDWHRIAPTAYVDTAYFIDLWRYDFQRCTGAYQKFFHAEEFGLVESVCY